MKKSLSLPTILGVGLFSQLGSYIAIFLAVTSLLVGCESARHEVIDYTPIEPLDMNLAEPPRDLSYELGEWDEADWPNPRYRSIYIRVDQSGVEKGRTLAYHAWDINHDGIADMLEVLRADGQVTMRLYDFDFDGQIDSSEKILENDGRRVIPVID